MKLELHRISVGKLAFGAQTGVSGGVLTINKDELASLLLQDDRLSAVAVDVEGARIAKSMSFKLADDAPIIIVTAGDRKIDNAKYKAYFHVKAKMLTFDEACAFTGHAPGGVCSFALPENVKTYLDVSLKRFDTVFPAAGSANSAIEMTCDELEKYSSNFVAWVDVCKEKAPAPQA